MSNSTIAAMHKTQVEFRVNSLKELPEIDNKQYQKVNCELIDGGLEFTALTSEKLEAGKSYTRIILNRPGKEETDMPFQLNPIPTVKDERKQETDKAMDYLASIDHGYTPEQIALMVANGIIPPNTPQPIITDFLAVCKMRGANPFIKDIYLIFKPSQKYGDKYIKVDSIGFSRKKANDTQKTAGIEFYYDGVDELEWCKTATATQVPNKITCIVYRREYQGAEKDAYRTTIQCSDYKNSGGHSFNTHALAMLNKCANMAALRVAFPEVLAEAYIEEEFQKGNNLESASVAQPAKVTISLPDATERLKQAELIEDLNERKMFLKELFQQTVHLNDIHLQTAIMETMTAQTHA